MLVSRLPGCINVVVVSSGSAERTEVSQDDESMGTRQVKWTSPKFRYCPDELGTRCRPRCR